MIFNETNNIHILAILVMYGYLRWPPENKPDILVYESQGKHQAHNCIF